MNNVRNSGKQYKYLSVNIMKGLDEPPKIAFDEN